VDRATTEQICRSLAEATARASEVFKSKLGTEQIHDRFWCVQDQLSRALESASENSGQFFAYQRNAFPSLFSDVIEMISFTSKTAPQHLRSCKWVLQRD
jgi:hypothetical protein